ALADFFADVLGRPMAMLPPLGVLRYDDLPGTAEQQLEGRDRSDARVERRIRRVVDHYRSSGGKLNFAITARALVDGEEAPPEAIWPRSLELIAEAVAEGTVEPVCHGYLHLGEGRREDGHVESREFATLDRPEALRRIGAALDWAEGALGSRPPTFVAPNWTY